MKKILFIIPLYDHPSSVASFRNTFWIKELIRINKFELKIFADTGVESSYIIKKKWDLVKEIFITDILVMSGPPFVPFLFVPVMKLLNPKVKIILDYRDPFSYNPRFKESFFRKKSKRLLEYVINFFSSKILTITSEAGKIIAAPTHKLEIIPNGYGDIGDLKKNFITKNKLIYTGRMYCGTNLAPLFEAIDFNLTYIGHSLLKHPRVDHKGTVSYSQSIDMIKESDCCLIYSNNSTYQTYTKLYDYIGCRKPILLIWEDSTIEHESFLEILRKYPLMRLAYNNKESIKSALEDISKTKIEEIDTFEFSRDYWFQSFERILTIR